jgi:hypothetical protein
MSADLFLLFLFNAGNGGSGNLEYRLIGASNKEAGVAHVGNNANYSTIGNNAVTGLKLRNRLLQFSLPLLLWPNQENVKDADDQKYRKQLD